MFLCLDIWDVGCEDVSAPHTRVYDNLRERHATPQGVRHACANVHVIDSRPPCLITAATTDTPQNAGRAAPKNRMRTPMTLVYTPSPSAAIDDDTPTQSFDDFLDVLAGLRLTSAAITLDLERRSLSIYGTPVKLCAKEFAVVAYLAENADRAVSRDELFTHVWKGSELAPESRAIDAQIRRLRQKFSAAPDLVTTVRGAGYRLNTSTGVYVRTRRSRALAA